MSYTVVVRLRKDIKSTATSCSSIDGFSEIEMSVSPGRKIGKGIEAFPCFGNKVGNFLIATFCGRHSAFDESAPATGRSGWPVRSVPAAAGSSLSAKRYFRPSRGAAAPRPKTWRRIRLGASRRPGRLSSDRHTVRLQLRRAAFKSVTD